MNKVVPIKFSANRREARPPWPTLPPTGEPVEINPSAGDGHRVMSLDEFTASWKHNPDLPECLACGSDKTGEHHFIQMWCRGKKKWESETFCHDCLTFSWRAYSDPDFRMPDEIERDMWMQMTSGAAPEDVQPF